MNLKDAFRFQNRLQALENECLEILSSDRNVTRIENTYLRQYVLRCFPHRPDLSINRYADYFNQI